MALWMGNWSYNPLLITKRGPLCMIFFFVLQIRITWLPFTKQDLGSFAPMVWWISARPPDLAVLQVVGCWVNIQKKIQVQPMIASTKIGTLFPLPSCPPVISRRIHLLWENIRKNIITVLEIHIVVFWLEIPKHHDIMAFCWGSEWDPYRFPVHNMCEKTKTSVVQLLVVLAYPEAKARVRKTILKQKQDLLGVMSSKSFKTEPIESIGTCRFQRFVLKKIFTQQKNFEKKHVFHPFFDNWVLALIYYSPKLCFFGEEQEQRLREIEEDRLLANRKVKSWDVEDEELGDWWCRRLLFFNFHAKIGENDPTWRMFLCRWVETTNVDKYKMAKVLIIVYVTRYKSKLIHVLSSIICGLPLFFGTCGPATTRVNSQPAYDKRTVLGTLSETNIGQWFGRWKTTFPYFRALY